MCCVSLFLVVLLGPLRSMRRATWRAACAISFVCCCRPGRLAAAWLVFQPKGLHAVT